MFFLMWAGLAGFGGLELFEDLSDFVNLEALSFFVFLDATLLSLEFPALAGGWDREAGLEDGRDGGSEEGSPEVVELESLPSPSARLWALAGRSLTRKDLLQLITPNYPSLHDIYSDQNLN